MVSGDFAQPTAATVFAMTGRARGGASPSAGANAFWDPAFRPNSTTGSNG